MAKVNTLAWTMLTVSHAQSSKFDIGKVDDFSWPHLTMSRVRRALDSLLPIFHLLQVVLSRCVART